MVADLFLAELQDSNVNDRYARDIVGNHLSMFFMISIPELDIFAFLAVLYLIIAELKVKSIGMFTYGIFFIIALPTHAASEDEGEVEGGVDLGDLPPHQVVPILVLCEDESDPIYVEHVPDLYLNHQ